MRRPSGADDDEDVAPEVARAYEALREGDAEAALVAAARVGDPVDRAMIEARAFLDLGMLEAAAGAVGRAREGLGEDDLDLGELAGELALDRWELDEAFEAFEAVARAGPDPWIWERRALLLDHRGDHDAAHRLMVEAAAMDDRPAPVRVDDEEFDRTVEEALTSLEPVFRRRLDNVRVVREPVPFRELVDPTDLAAVPPDVLGLFVGPTIHDLASDVSGELPPTIYLFQRNLERVATSRDELAEEIRITLFHEIGHLLGLDEDEVADLGLA